MATETYHVEGNHILGYAVVHDGGGIEYDLLESQAEADEICDVLNQGVGPEWDAVSAALTRENPVL